MLVPDRPLEANLAGAKMVPESSFCLYNLSDETQVSGTSSSGGSQPGKGIAVQGDSWKYMGSLSYLVEEKESSLHLAFARQG